jgi:hypothetical protein
MVCTPDPPKPVVGAACYVTQGSVEYHVYGRDGVTTEDLSDQDGWFQLSGTVFKATNPGESTPPVVLNIDAPGFVHHEFPPPLQADGTTYWLTHEPGTGSGSSAIELAVEERQYDAVWRPGTSGEMQYYGLKFADYQKHYDDLWKKNYRIYLLNTYEENG